VFRRLRRFFYSDDPDVKLVAGVNFDRAREVLAPFLEANLPTRRAGRRHVRVPRKPSN
jgi:hypothetical protein